MGSWRVYGQRILDIGLGYTIARSVVSAIRECCYVDGLWESLGSSSVFFNQFYNMDEVGKSAGVLGCRCLDDPQDRWHQPPIQ